MSVPYKGEALQRTELLGGQYRFQLQFGGNSVVAYDDFAFATRDGLVAPLEPNTSPVGYESSGVTAPFTRKGLPQRMRPHSSHASR